VKEAIATEEIFNSYGDLITVRYHYADKTTREIKKFIPNYLSDVNKSQHSKPNKT